MNEWEWELLEDKAPLDSIRLADNAELRKGDSVRLHPLAGGDVMDLALAGKTAVVESIEQDYEGAIQLGVIVDDDPGSDIGAMRQPGHRFFFRPEEVELLAGTGASAVPPILVAGIGNVFFGDDGFGVEVAARMDAGRLPAGAQVIDFGIRSYDLAYTLTSGRYGAAILVDASTRGGEPGSIYVLAPALEEDSPEQNPQPAPANAHAMNPDTVLRMARALGPLPAQILVVACEPETLGGEQGHMGLSEIVDASVARAVSVVESLSMRIAGGEQIEAVQMPEEKTPCK